MKVLHWLWVVVALGSCRFEALEELDARFDECSNDSCKTKVWLPFVEVVPRVEDDSQLGLGWRATLHNHLSFLSDPVAAGRRPDSAGARMTQQHIVNTFVEAGLTPDGSHNWVQSVPLDLVKSTTVQLEIDFPSQPPKRPTTSPTDPKSDVEVDQSPPPPAPEEISTFAVDTGVYVRHDGTRLDRRLKLVHAPIDSLCDLTAGESASGDECVRADGALVIAELESTSFESEKTWFGLEFDPFERARRARAVGCLLLMPSSTLARASVIETASRPTVNRRLVADANEPQLSFYGYADRAVFDVLKVAHERDATVHAIVDGEHVQLNDANVVGRLPGAESPRDVILVMSHWDAGGISPPLPQGGALIDNGTGVAVLLAVAEVSGRWYGLGRRPRRSIVFAATAAGSLNHAGAQELRSIPGLGSDNVVAVINLDTLDWRSPTLRAIDGGRSTMLSSAGDFRDELVPVPATETWGHSAYLMDGVPGLSLTRAGERTDDPSFEVTTDVTVLARDADSVFRWMWDLADDDQVPTPLPFTVPVDLTDPDEPSASEEGDESPEND